MDLQKKKRSKEKVDIKKFMGSYGKYCVLAVLALILIVVIVAVSIGQGNGGDDSEGDVIPMETGGEVYSSDFSRYELKEDAYPEINSLYETYYTAMKNGDVETLSNIVDGYEFTQEEVDKEREYVEDYRNIKCYTIDGLLENTYIVYVYNEVKFYNIDTWAPGLYGSYVCRNEDGTVYINEGMVEGEVAAFIEEMDNSEAVRDLNAQVDQALLDAQSQDPALDNLVKMLKEGSGQTQESSGEEPQTTEPEASESETQSGETAASQESSSEAAQSQEAAMEFETVDETVYATQNVNIRKTPDENGERAGRLAGSASIQRVGYNQEWSQVMYNGEVCYIKSEYLTTIAP